ncbi:glutaminase A [Gulosibacter faecalis]|uniref:Glutaminase n=1 Tax=Gulosibacter faecalis TaxID=272240 RepID=A0ABW5UYA0_9MICO|nr:glutaminase A [Gulosibacter faecalis]
MKTPLPDYLEEAMLDCADGGAVADYIPELAEVDPDQFGIAICTPDGTQYASGDADVEFSIQSASKPFAYALAVEQRGAAGVEEHVNVEPSGDPFNSASVDELDGRPDNPMINIGAITTYALTTPDDWSAAERFEHVRAGMSAFAGRELEVDADVYHSEIATSYRNMSLAYLVRSTGHFTLEPSEVVAGYTRQCAIRVTARDLSVMGMTLGSGGVNPITGERVVSEETAQRVLSVMSTCGMYNASGDWMTDVGIPAKSGVGGGIFGVLPGQVGAATFSPRLDRFGNSVRGVRLFERLSRDMGMHIMGVPPAGDGVVHTFRLADDSRGEHVLVALQGALRFAQTERALRTFEDIPVDGRDVVIDLSRVSSADGVGLRMLTEGVRRLGLDGHRVDLHDPKDVLQQR